MKKFLIRWGINSLALFAAVMLVRGVHAQDTQFLSIIGLAFIFGIINALLRPILRLLTCPLIILSLGLFTLVINTFLFYLAGRLGRHFGVGFTVDGIWPAFVGALVVSIVSFIMSLLLKSELKERKD